MIITVEIQVFGKVQGVWYRASTRNKALELGLKGWVQNEPDGSVRMVLTGALSLIKQMNEWCKEGPPHARVDQLTQKELPLVEFSNFEIRR